MQEAMRACLDYALHKHNRSVAQVAELIGVTEWVVYKWMSDGSIPSKRIRPFEFACDATFVTHYLASSAQKLIIDIPTGKKTNNEGMMDLQNTLNESVKVLCEFYKGDLQAKDVMGVVTAGIAELASHRENVSKHDAPELDLFHGGASDER
jgi:hypothetical protein